MERHSVLNPSFLRMHLHSSPMLAELAFELVAKYSVLGLPVTYGNSYSGQFLEGSAFAVQTAAKEGISTSSQITINEME